MRMLYSLFFLCLGFCLTSVTIASNESAADVVPSTSDLKIGYDLINKAFHLVDRAFSLIENQDSGCTTGTANTFEDVVDRLERLETLISDNKRETVMMVRNLTLKLENLEETVDSRLGQLESMMEARLENCSSGEIGLKLEVQTTLIEGVGEKVQNLEGLVDNKTSRIEEMVDKTVDLSEKAVQLTSTVQRRQQTWLSEIRLISLFKMTGENNPHGSRDYNPGIVVDGQFVFTYPHESQMRTYSHTASGVANNKIWIDLGGLFRVYHIGVWNTREGSKPRFSSTNIYVDDTLVGTASGDWGYHDFPLPEENAVYGSRVTLHQPRADYIILLEVQVWGNGPYNSTDLFN